MEALQTAADVHLVGHEDTERLQNVIQWGVGGAECVHHPQQAVMTICLMICVCQSVCMRGGELFHNVCSLL